MKRLDLSPIATFAIDYDWMTAGGRTRARRDCCSRRSPPWRRHDAFGGRIPG
jgi:hypothetical protein